MNSSGAVANEIGEPVRREEDSRLLTGKGSFADHIRPAEVAHAVIVRSPIQSGEDDARFVLSLELG